MTAPLIARLLLDTLDAFAGAIEHVPGPGRGRRIGRLNAAGWTIAHTASTTDAWVNVYGQELEPEPWTTDWHARQQSAGEPPVETAFDEAREAFASVVERAAPYLEGCDDAALAEVCHALDRSAWRGSTKGYLVARGVAHVFAHAGELAVVASLTRSEDRDLGLPGALARSTGSGDEAAAAGEGRPAVVRLLLDARHEFTRVAQIVPVPAQAGAFDRLNSGGWMVAHAASQDDQYWNVCAQGFDADPWLAAAGTAYRDPPARPDYAEATEALARAHARSLPYLEQLAGSEFGRAIRQSPVPGRGSETVSDLVVREGAHYFALAGELAALASLAGAEDPGLPGATPHLVDAAT